MAQSAPDTTGADDEIIVIQHYDINKDVVREDDNVKRLRHVADSLISDGLLESVVIEGYASPDGPYPLNSRLALARAKSLRTYLINRLNVPAGQITISSKAEDWDGLIQAMPNHPATPAYDRALDIMTSRESTDRREARLRSLAEGRTWRYLSDNIFPDLRRTITRFRYKGGELAVTIPSEVVDALTEGETAIEEPAIVDVVEEEDVIIPTEPTVQEEYELTPEPCPSGWHLSTNLLEWGLAITNIAGEYDFAPHWSGVLSLHYSAWNYGKSTRKFRTFIFRPEVRYWFGDCHSGLFADAHLQMAAYNFALPSWQYRIQDVGGKNPALGGGVGLGYRLNFGPGKHWGAQAQVGVGVYHLYYNRFQNRDNGPLYDTRRRTWAGIDNVALSIVYNFNSSSR